MSSNKAMERCGKNVEQKNPHQHQKLLHLAGRSLYVFICVLSSLRQIIIIIPLVQRINVCGEKFSFFFLCHRLAAHRLQRHELCLWVFVRCASEVNVPEQPTQFGAMLCTHVYISWRRPARIDIGAQHTCVSRWAYVHALSVFGYRASFSCLISRRPIPWMFTVPICE